MLKYFQYYQCVMDFRLVFETAPFDHSGTPPWLSSETRDYINHRLRGSKPGDGSGGGRDGGAKRQNRRKMAG
jgi:hypothetical protein